LCAAFDSADPAILFVAFDDFLLLSALAAFDATLLEVVACPIRLLRRATSEIFAQA
jgi:hypothetical protein